MFVVGIMSFVGANAAYLVWVERKGAARFQRRPGLTPADAPKLKVKWSFSMTGGGQPTVVGDWLFVTNRSGKFYALDARTGCVHWSVDDLVSRTTPMVIKSPISPSGWLTVVSESDRVVRAFDARPEVGEQVESMAPSWRPIRSPCSPARR